MFLEDICDLPPEYGSEFGDSGELVFYLLSKQDDFQGMKLRWLHVCDNGYMRLCVDY